VRVVCRIGESAQLPKVAILTYGRSAEYSLEKRTIRSLLGPRASNCVYDFRRQSLEVSRSYSRRILI